MYLHFHVVIFPGTTISQFLSNCDLVKNASQQEQNKKRFPVKQSFSIDRIVVPRFTEDALEFPWLEEMTISPCIFSARQPSLTFAHSSIRVTNPE